MIVQPEDAGTGDSSPVVNKSGVVSNTTPTTTETQSKITSIIISDPVPVSDPTSLPNVNDVPPVTPVSQVTTPPPSPTPISNVSATLTPYTPGSVNFPISITIASTPNSAEAQFEITINVLPPVPEFVPAIITIPSSLTINPIPLSIKTALMNVVNTLIANKVETFFDVDRAGKTLVNFGNDYQALMTNWMSDLSDTTGATIFVKLYLPLPSDVNTKTMVWISRELSPPIIDRIWVQYQPAPLVPIYLRPANKNITVVGRQGASVDKVSLSNLLSSQSFNEIRPTDPVLEHWFTDDINSAELNINFGDYREFVFFGSAQTRLDAFVGKLKLIENLESLLSLHSSSLSLTTGSITGSLTYPAIQAYGDQRIDLLRSFDAYERFLYYETAIPYSASLMNDDVDDTYSFYPDATYPKTNGTGSVVSVSSSLATIWYQNMSSIASSYDNLNPNFLANSLPAYILDDGDSEQFVRFLSLTGHQFDTVKVYIDNMPKLYNRDSDPTQGMSPDLVYNVAQSFGIDLPNPHALVALNSYTIGTETSPKVYREIIAETWKRFLHNQIFMMKTKGTKTALRSLANSYGILPTTLQIRESAIVGTGAPADVYEEYDEQTNALSINSSAYITIPWKTLPASASTIETRFSTTVVSTTVILQADNTWAMVLSPTTGSLGVIKIVSGSTNIIQSGEFDIFGGDFYHVMLRYQISGSTLEVKQGVGYEIIEESITIESGSRLSNIFNSPNFLYLGGSGSAFLAPTFQGYIDEFRIWSEQTTDDTFDMHVRYPGLYNGNSITSARDNLLVRLSFNKPVNLGVTSVIANESPYVIYYNASSIATLPVHGFLNIPSYPNNMEVIVRTVARQSPDAASTYSTNKTIVEPPAVLTYISGSTIPVLSRQDSIVSLTDKYIRNKPTNTVGFYFSLTEAINDSIIRSIGNINLQDLIGDPQDQYNSSYSQLMLLDDLYWSTYAYHFNVNRFTDFVGEILTPMFQQAVNLIPARAKLLSGIVHEPHILERSKVVTSKPIILDDDITLEADPVTTQPDNVLGDYLTEDTILEVNDTITLTPALAYWSTTISQSLMTTIQSDYDSYDAYLTHNILSYVSSSFLYYESELNLNLTANYFTASDVTFDIQEFVDSSQPNSQAIISVFGYMNASKAALPVVTYDDELVVIEPYTDFNDIGAFTYFTDPTGLIYVEVLSKIRQNLNVINARGTWVSGQIYSKNDYVLQYDPTDTSTTDGNNKEFVCISPDQTFVSIISPFLDTRNWAAMRYVTSIILTLKRVVFINGVISIVDPSDTTDIPVVGYQPQHYKFTRDNRRGIINHQYMGCLQDDTTTTDGNPAVQILPSAGDTLIVLTAGEPIQPVNNQSGPILDVQ